LRYSGPQAIVEPPSNARMTSHLENLKYHRAAQATSFTGVKMDLCSVQADGRLRASIASVGAIFRECPQLRQSILWQQVRGVICDVGFVSRTSSHCQSDATIFGQRSIRLDEMKAPTEIHHRALWRERSVTSGIQWSITIAFFKSVDHASTSKQSEDLFTKGRHTLLSNLRGAIVGTLIKMLSSNMFTLHMMHPRDRGSAWTPAMAQTPRGFGRAPIAMTARRSQYREQLLSAIWDEAAGGEQWVRPGRPGSGRRSWCGDLRRRVREPREQLRGD